MNDEEEAYRVYAAEGKWRSRYSAHMVQLSESEIKNLVSRLSKRFKVPPPQIIITMDAVEASWYSLWDRGIFLAMGWGQFKDIVLHELAHHISRGLGHDKLFRQTNLELIKIEYGRKAMMVLQEEYIEQGLEC